MPKKAFKKQKQYETDMRLRAKAGLMNKADGTFAKPDGGSAQMHMSGALHHKV